MPLPDGYRVAADPSDRGPWKNRLSLETSPYLLQHAHNPVDWRPWGPEALAEARAQEKPIFLSIGYAACHWCHVMERESFEDPATAAALNRDFIPVKVDREERPDVDALYIDALHAMNTPAGWPLSVWLTPELDAFYGGTYFPPVWRYGTPGFRSVLESLASAWRDNRDGQRRSALKIREALLAGSDLKRAAAPADRHEVRRGLEALEEHWDERGGGWGAGAKFPMCPNVELLLLAGALLGDAGARGRAEALLDAVDCGGIHDHLGGGFHRYAVDPSWEVPHFEKMLYDNGQLLRLYAEAIALGCDRFRPAAAGIVRWLRAMRHPSGAFYASQDADSPGPGGEKEEGLYYVWTRDQLRSALSREAARRFESAYKVREWGNFDGGTTALNRAEGVDPEDRLLSQAREVLLQLRSRRPPPDTDTKRVVAWNGLAVSGLARGGRLLGEPEWIALAEGAAEAILASSGPDGALPRTLEAGSPAGVLADYALTAEGLLDLYEARLDPRWLLEAESIALAALARFSDAEGRLYQAEDGALPIRRLAIQEGAEPSGAGRMLEVLRRLELYGSDRIDPEISERCLRALAGHIQDDPGAWPSLLAQLLLRSSPTVELVVSAPDLARAAPLLDAWNTRWRPAGALGLLTPGDVEPLAGFTSFRNRDPRPDRPRAFLCQDRSCGLPTSTPAGLQRQLDRLGEG